MADFLQLNRLKEFRHGLALYNVNDIYIGRSLELYGEYSHGETELFEQLVQPGDIVVEAGANIGVHTVFFAKAVGPTGSVLAFEPQCIVYQTLCANIALNSLTNVYCYQMGLADKPGTMRVPPLNYAQPNNFGGMSLSTDAQGEAVSVLRLDSFPLTSCKLLKVDVEGMELQTLQGASGIIERHKPVLYVENDRADKAVALVRYIDSIDYAMYWHVPSLFNPNNYRKNPVNVFSDIVSKNLLCIHKSIPVNIQGVPPLVVPK